MRTGKIIKTGKEADKPTQKERSGVFGHFEQGIIPVDRTNKALFDPSAVKNKASGQTQDIVAGADSRILFDVYFGHPYPLGHNAAKLLDYRTEGPAGTAPGSPAIEKNGDGGANDHFFKITGCDNDRLGQEEFLCIQTGMTAPAIGGRLEFFGRNFVFSAAGFAAIEKRANFTHSSWGCRAARGRGKPPQLRL